MGSKKIVAASGVVLFVVLIAILIVTLVLSQQKTTTKSQAAPGATLTVCPTGTAGQNGCNYIGGNGISQAIYAANNNDTIHVKAGSYTPSAGFTIIDKTLTIEGEGISNTFISGYNISQTGAGLTISGNSQVSLSKISFNAFYPENRPTIYLSGSAYLLASNIQISDTAGTAILTDTLSHLKLTNSLVRYSYRGALLFDNGDPNQQSEIINNTFISNGSTNPQINQINLFRGANVLMENNIIVNGSSGGIYLANQGTSSNFFGTLIFKYNDTWNNAGGNYLGSMANKTGQDGNLSVDPKFNSKYYDFTLQSSSPAVNTGDPNSTFNDPDGTRSDMGAYGGPGAIIPSNTDCLIEEVEPNDGFTEATLRNRFCPGDIKGSLNLPSDYSDAYRFVLSSTQEITLDLTNIPLSSDYDLALFDGDGLFYSWSDAAGQDPEKITRVLRAGTYYAQVVLFKGGSTAQYNLRLTLNDPPPPSTITLRVKFAGLTSDVGPITASRVIIRTQDWSTFSQKFEGDESLIFNYVNGAYQTIIPDLYLSSGINTYDVLVKGPSHLQSKVTGRLGVTIPSNLIGQNILIDRSNTATTDIVKAGDVVKLIYNQYGQSSAADGQDGVLTIEDLTAVAAIYTSLQSPVPTGLERRDINRDGFITIEDLAMVAYNFSSLAVYEDQ